MNKQHSISLNTVPPGTEVFCPHADHPFPIIRDTDLYDGFYSNGRMASMLRARYEKNKNKPLKTDKTLDP
jgi:hypothetical protein